MARVTHFPIGKVGNNWYIHYSHLVSKKSFCLINFGLRIVNKGIYNSNFARSAYLLHYAMFVSQIENPKSQ